MRMARRWAREIKKKRMARMAQIKIHVEGGAAQYDMETSDENPCLSCGACCQHFRVSFYCGELEEAKAGGVPSALASQIAPLRACMKGTESGGGRCAALIGEPGQPGIGCSIYAQRPSPCREYAVWGDDGEPNPDCQRLRAKIGLGPLSRRAPA